MDYFSIVFLVGIALLFYYVLIKPRRRQQQQVADMLANLEIGDEVLTTAGIYGQIDGFDEGTVMLRIDDNTVIKISRQAIAQPVSYKENWDDEDEQDSGDKNMSEDPKAIGSDDPDGSDNTA